MIYKFISDSPNYLSPDFNGHPVPQLFLRMLGVFGQFRFDVAVLVQVFLIGCAACQLTQSMRFGKR